MITRPVEDCASSTYGVPMSRSRLQKITGDLAAVRRQLGLTSAIRYLAALVVKAPTIIREGNLQPADRMMNQGGVLTYRHPACDIRLSDGDFSGAREMYLRDVYGMAGTLKIAANGLVVDLGANVGHFSVLALRSNPTARLIAVEAAADFAAPFHATMERNGVSDRAQLCRAFIGHNGPLQQEVSTDPRYRDAEWIDEDAFIARYKIADIDLLKIDIEGSEYAFMDPSSRLLSMARQLALEVHGFAGDAHAFIAGVQSKGFKILSIDWDGDSCIALARREDA